MKGPVRDASTFNFNATAKAVTFSSPIPASQQQILGILNVTRQAWLYLPVEAGYGGTWASPVLTLTASTTGHADGDVLQIFVDDGLASTAVTASALPLPTGAATAANQATSNTTLTSIDAKSLALPTADAQASVSTSTTTVQLLAARTARKRLMIFNPSGGATLSIGSATPVTAANTFLAIPAGNGVFLDQADFPSVAGAWYGLLASGTSTAQVRESY